MEKSRVVGQEEYYHPGRTSSNAFLNKAHDKVVQCIERRASQITDKPVPNIENLQVHTYFQYY